MSNSTRNADGTSDDQLLEAAALKRLWDERSRMPQAEFGEKFNIGGQSAVNNFLSGRSSLSLKAATGFAIGLGVPIREFSPRLDAEAQLIAKAASPVGSSLKYDPVGAVIEYDRTLGRATSPPLLGELRYDEGRGSVDYNHYGRLTTQHVSFWSKEDSYAARIVGDHFFPRYRAGELLILSSGAPPVPGADVLVSLDNLTKHLVQWNRETDTEVSLLPLNGSGRPMTVSKSTIADVERVLGSVPASSVFDVSTAIDTSSKK